MNARMGALDRTDNTPSATERSAGKRHIQAAIGGDVTTLSEIYHDNTHMAEALFRSGFKRYRVTAKTRSGIGAKPYGVSRACSHRNISGIASGALEQSGSRRRPTRHNV